MMNEIFQLINSDVSLLLIRRIKMLILKLILAARRRDYWTYNFLLKDIIISLRKNLMLYIA